MTAKRTRGGEKVDFQGVSCMPIDDADHHHPLLRSFVSLLDSRRSCRAFSNKPISTNNLNQILQASNSAPSAGNLQAFSIVVFNQHSEENIGKPSLYGASWFPTAPVILVFCALPKRSSDKYHTRGRRLYCIQDATIACSYAQLMATALGLGSCWLGAFHEETVCSILGLDSREDLPIALLPIGHPQVQIYHKQRRFKLEDLATWL